MGQTINLSPNFSMPAVDYAGQGNAILGIRDAGKTYTAMKAAEQLLDAKIPIICYDPVGVWKNLKVGRGKHKGYPVVVAGGEGSDIRLSENNAVDIVRAAMKENVSLVIDLYSPELINKSKWIRIVQETVDLLMYENKSLRHIFIEEAAEFIPQRLQPQHSRVYASLERLARMGRNARLGYTLINQRAEEINKAILEISAMSLLHKQVGKNSLKSIQTWLELLQVDNAKDIIQSLPGLTQGECWVIGQGTKPHRIKITGRKTFHPDPKQNIAASDVTKMKVDVSSFVDKLNKQLTIPAKETKPAVSVPSSKDVNQFADMEKRFYEYRRLTEKQIVDQKRIIQEQHKVIAHYTARFEQLRHIVLKEPVINVDDLKGVEIPIETNPKGVERSAVPVSKSLTDHNQKFADNVYSTVKKNNGSLGKCALSILAFLASFPERAWTKAQAGIATGYSPGSGGFNNALSELNAKDLIFREGGKLQVNVSETTLQSILGADFKPQQYSIHTFKDKLGKCEREIYEVLLAYPDKTFSKAELADETASSYSPTSGGFNNALSTLNTLELIKRQTGTIRLNPELLEL